MLDPEMIKKTAKIVEDAIKDRVQINLLITNRSGAYPPRLPNSLQTGFIKRSIMDSSMYFPQETVSMRLHSPHSKVPKPVP